MVLDLLLILKLIAMYTVPSRKSGHEISNKAKFSGTDPYIHKLAFDHTQQANIVYSVRSGKIILANGAACKLLGYSQKMLLTKNKSAIFNTGESSFKEMLRQRTHRGHSTGMVTVIKKSGKLLFCRISSATFTEKDGTEKSISTIADMNQNVLEQNIIDRKKGKVTAKNTLRAKIKSDARLKDGLSREIRIKERQILEATQDAKENERSDIAKELHDNINQLLAASKMYIDMAKRGGEKSTMYLGRSSQYTLEAIEEIRKLTKGLTSDIIKNLGLIEAIENIARDTMETSSLKISMQLGSFDEYGFDDKFKLNIYRIVQEQLNNILKHAKAHFVSISLKQSSTSVVLEISDNGVGFDTSKKSKGIGLANIKSRAMAFKGTADFVSTLRKGCTLRVTFILAKK